MKYTVSENLGEKKGVVSNLHCFINRNLDTGFKTKWSGIWAPPYKYLDYYGIKINGIWLNQETLQATEYGDKMILHHEAGGIKVKEVIKAPADSPGITVALELKNNDKQKKAVHTLVEPGVDIRHKSQDTLNKDHKIEKGSNKLKISRNGKELIITSNKKFQIQGRPKHREHYPGEKQKCIVPGKVSFKNEVERSKTVRISFKTSKESPSKLEKQNQDLEHKDLGRLFNCSIDSIRNLVYDQEGTGVIAGHPWFQSYWARDTFWTILGLIDAGQFKLCEKMLTNFAKKELPSKININKQNRTKYKGKTDTSPLFLIAADKLKTYFGTNQKIQEGVEKAKNQVETNKQGIVLHDPEGTWMDTLSREKAVEIQSLWLEASKRHDMKQEKNLREGLERFEQENHMKDSLREKHGITANPAVPLMFKQVDTEKAERYLERMNAELSSTYGARTMSMLNPDYTPKGYHTGSTWGLTTAWLAAANIRYSNQKQAKNMLKKQSQFLDTGQLGALPETVNSETGKNIGCSEQAWSAALIPHIIDKHLLGINVKSPEKATINPVDNLSCLRKGKKIGDSRIDLKIEQGSTKILNKPKTNITIKN